MTILIVTFEPLDSSGGGLSTYMRNVIKAHKEVGLNAVVLAVNHQIKDEKKYTDGTVRIIE